MGDYLRPTDPAKRIDIKKFVNKNEGEAEDNQKKHLIKQSLGMLTAWAKTRPTARLYEGSVYNNDHQINVLDKRRAKNKVAKRSRRINRTRG